MCEKLIKFFEEYKKLFREGMSTGDGDDVLMRLMMILDDTEADQIISDLKNNGRT